MRAPFRLAVFALATLWLGCSPAKPPEVSDPRERGLYAEPRRLAFTCVAPGCDSTQTVRVSLVGDRRIAIKRIILSSDAGSDFTFKSSEAAPFILGVKSEFTIDVHYAPQGSPGSGSVELTITYTDASAVDSPDRIEPGELKVPLVRRLVGEPVLIASPPLLSFGVVWPGSNKTLPVHLENAGFGNVALDVASVDAGNPDLKAQIPANLALLPDAGFDLPITWTPAAGGYLKASLVITPGNAEVDPAVVTVEGTSFFDQRLGVEPEGDVEFGEVPRKQQKLITRQLVNQGGAALNIQSVVVTDASGNVSGSLPDGGTSMFLPPLARVPLEIRLDGQNPAELDARIKVTSNDPQRPVLELHVVGTVTEPKLQVTPATVDFGGVPVGWVMIKPIELRNVGFGPLTLKNITLVAGSSTLYTVRNLPALPSVLDRDQRLAIEVEFRAETAAAFSGTLSVETDDPQVPFTEVALSSTAGSCTANCPISHGTPTCARGVCEIDACDVGWYDTDQSASSGCECKEIGTDPGSFCADGTYVGNLKDTSHQSASFTGVLPVAGDTDIVKFHAEDASNWFSDDFDVRIRLVSSDPNIKMCVYRYNTGSHLPDCYWTNEECPQDGNYRKDGSLGSGDDADFIIKVYRTPGAAPTCTSYSLYMSNG